MPTRVSRYADGSADGDQRRISNLHIEEMASSDRRDGNLFASINPIAF